jgi:serine/threonine protein kinase
LVGRTLTDRYRIDALVGVGGMGAVYSAHHLGLDRRVAFKILLPHLALSSQQVLPLFEREAKVVARLSHENIVTVLDAGRTADEVAYIAMEWLDGHTLEEEIADRGPLSFERTAELLQQITAALEAAHVRHIIHRDLKPSNIMLVKQEDGRERVKVLDFGIGKVITDTAGSPVSSMMGTPHYASPEQFQVGKQIDGRTDIYSLGVMLYQMLTGALPFDATSVHELVRLHMTAAPPPLRNLRPDAPAGVERLLDRMMAKEPDQRPQRAREVPMLFAHALSGTDASQAATLVESAPAQTVAQAPGETVVRGSETVPVNKPRKADPEDAATLSLPSSAAEALRQTPSEAKSPGAGPAKIWLPVAAIGLVLLIGVVFAYRSWAGKQAAGERAVMPGAKANSGPGSPAVTAPARTEAMQYYLEMEPSGSVATRATGLEPLEAGRRFKFHFVPRESGYLYIIALGRGNVLKTFLTARPLPASGLKTNQVAAGSEFTFPGGDAWLVIDRDAETTPFTIIFSPSPLDRPSFFAAQSGRSLTEAEQQDLATWRAQFKAEAPETTAQGDDHQARVVVNVPESAKGRPLVFDIPIKHK